MTETKNQHQAMEESLVQLETALEQKTSKEQLSQRVDELLANYDTLKKGATEAAIMDSTRAKIQSLLSHETLQEHEDLKTKLETLLAPVEKPADPKIKSTVDDLFSELLINPNLIKADRAEIKDANLRAALQIAEGFAEDPEKWAKFEASLRTGKEPTGLIAKLQESLAVERTIVISEGEVGKEEKKEIKIKSPKSKTEAEKLIYDIDREIPGLETKEKTLMEEIRGLEAIAGKPMAAGQAVNAEAEAGRENERKTKYDELKKVRKTLNEIKQIKADIEKITPYLSTEKLTPKQVLLKALAIEMGTDNLEGLAERAEEVLREQEQTKVKKEKGWEKALSVASPTLDGTLKKIITLPILKEITEENVALLIKNRKNPDGIKEWMEEIGIEKAKKNIPVLMAYLKLALEEGHLNALSRKGAEELLKNLRIARGKVILEQINNNPDLRNQKPQIKMEAYLKEINGWDEGVKNINKKILEDLVTESRVKKGTALGMTLAGGWVIGWPALRAMGGFLGWGNALAGAALIPAEKGIKHFAPKLEKVEIPKRALGLFMLGPVGLFAPEAIKGVKWAFKNKESVQKHAGTGAKIAGTAGRGIWGVAKGVGRAITYPFRKKAA